VDAGVASRRIDRELGQLLVVAAGQVLPDLAQHLLDDVEVVEQPLRVEPTILAAFAAPTIRSLTRIRIFSSSANWRSNGLLARPAGASVQTDARRRA